MTFTRMLLLLLSCIALHNAAAFNQEQHTHVEVAVPGTAFGPGAQQRATFRLKDVNVTVEPSAPLSLHIEHGGTTRRIQMPAELVQVNGVRMYSQDRLIITGMVNGDVWMTVIADLAQQSAIDSFLCYTPEVSPDGRYIAFIKFFPAHGISSAEDHVMLYDVSRTPVQNRPSEASRDSAVVGQLLYPPGAGNRAGDNVDLGARPAHRVASDSFFWNKASTEFVFADALDRTYSAVVVSAAKPRASVESGDIPRDYICPATNQPCYETLTSVDFGDADDPVRMTFRGVNGTPERRSSVLVSRLSTGLEVRAAK